VSWSPPKPHAAGGPTLYNAVTHRYKTTHYARPVLAPTGLDASQKQHKQHKDKPQRPRQIQHVRRKPCRDRASTGCNSTTYAHALQSTLQPLEIRTGRQLDCFGRESETAVEAGGRHSVSFQQPPSEHLHARRAHEAVATPKEFIDASTKVYTKCLHLVLGAQQADATQRPLLRWLLGAQVDSEYKVEAAARLIRVAGRRVREGVRLLLG